MKQLLILSFCCFAFYSCYAQEINVEREQFKGVKKVVVKSYGRLSAKFHYHPNQFSGYKAKYTLNDSGKVVLEKRYNRGKLVAVYEYTYDKNNLLSKQIAKYDFNNQDISDYCIAEYTYKFNEINQVLEKKKTINNLSSYILTTNTYDDSGIVTKENNKLFLNENVFSQSIYYYENGMAKQIEYTSNSSSHKRSLQCDSHGNILRSDLFDTIDNDQFAVKSTYAGSYPGDPEHMNNFYVYDSKGRWIKMYCIVDNKKLLIEKRRYIK